jgi:tetratricopeptide (TPR) repeat protein
MDSEEMYINRVGDLVSETWEADNEVFSLLEQALHEYPNSPAIWVLRGRMILLGDKNSPYQLKDALESFEKALTLDSTYAQAYEEIGYYKDVYLPDYVGAEHAFRKAIRLGAGARSYEGLARVLAELDRPDEALRFLSECHSNFDVGRKEELEKEIRAGLWGKNRTNKVDGEPKPPETSPGNR